MKSADRMMLRIQKQEQVLAWVSNSRRIKSELWRSLPTNSNSPYIIE